VCLLACDSWYWLTSQIAYHTTGVELRVVDFAGWLLLKATTESFMVSDWFCCTISLPSVYGIGLGWFVAVTGGYFASLSFESTLYLGCQA
jgi:uncharacterized membrane protein